MELPPDVSYIAIAQDSLDSDVCVAFVADGRVGDQAIQSNGSGNGPRNIYSSDQNIDRPSFLHDAVFSKTNELLAVGAASTPDALQGAGEPTKWIDGVSESGGLDKTVAGNSGAFFSANRQGVLVGENDLRPIIHESKETTELPLPGEASIGSAFDLNEDWIVGYADADAVVWEHADDGYKARILSHRQSDAFGSATSISTYGVVGGSYRRTTAEDSFNIGFLWNRDGSILREFDLGGDTTVTHVIDYLAAVSGPDGTSIFQPATGELSTLGNFLRGLGLDGVPGGRLELTDLELSNDGRRVLLLFDHHEPLEFRQLAASVDVDQFPVTWQHPWEPHDVNHDGRISPIDALQIINRLSRDPNVRLPPKGNLNGPFFDVNGDFRVTPLDALRIINQLARLGA